MNFVIKYIEKDMNVQHTDEDPIYFDRSDLSKLNDILNMKQHVTEKMQETCDKNLVQILMNILCVSSSSSH